MAMSGGRHLNEKLRVVYRRRAADDNKITAGARALAERTRQTTARTYTGPNLPVIAASFMATRANSFTSAKIARGVGNPGEFSRVSTARLPRAMGAIEEAPPCGFHCSAL